MEKTMNEKIREYLLQMADAIRADDFELSGLNKEEVLAYLERQKEQQPLSTEETELNSIAFLEQMGYTCIPPGKEQQPEAIGGVVHHSLNKHWIVVDQKQLNAILKEFPEGTNVELFISAKKEE